MIKRLLLSSLLAGVFLQGQIQAHCQMPCGIYHDEMVYDQIDQYVETMVKGISVLMENKFDSLQAQNTFVRWIMEKEKSSNEIAQLITVYFLQQKIKPNEEDTAKRVLSAHKLLFLLVRIKQTADLQAVNDFYEEWENFKLMFHIEGYKCKVNQAKLKKWAEKKRQRELENQSNSGQPNQENERDHDHDHEDHDHSH